VQTPPRHESARVQALASVQAAPSGATGAEQRPVVELHVPGRRQVSGAGQTTGLPPVHTPVRQVSVCVHASPSLQAAPSGRAGLEQTPVAGLQVPGRWH
jgi:hypothetical protein